MSTWQKIFQDRRQRNWLIALALSALLLVAGLLMLTRPRTADQQEVANRQAASNGQPVSASAAQETAANMGASSEAEVAEAATSASVGTEIVLGPSRAQLMRARLEAHLAAQPIATFQRAAPIKYSGPRRIQFTVGASGSDHNHVLGQASYAPTDVEGAAGEWLVRPWWKPGWLPGTADCGQAGTAAIGGHVSWFKRPGPFYDIGAMIAGEEIRCQAANGQWFTYIVTHAYKIEYTDTQNYWQPTQDPQDKLLTLFTCTPEITGIIVIRAQLAEQVAEAELANAEVQNESN